MSRTTLSALALCVAVYAAGALTNLLFTAHTVNTSQQRWCSTLDLLTAHAVPKPSDPAANPSRENAYIFYTNLRQLREEFGCG